MPPCPPPDPWPPPCCAERGADANKSTNAAMNSGRCIPLIICRFPARRSRNYYLPHGKLGLHPESRLAASHRFPAFAFFASAGCFTAVLGICFAGLLAFAVPL